MTVCRENESSCLFTSLKNKSIPLLSVSMTWPWCHILKQYYRFTHPLQNKETLRYQLLNSLKQLPCNNHTISVFFITVGLCTLHKRHSTLEVDWSSPLSCNDNQTLNRSIFQAYIKLRSMQKYCKYVPCILQQHHRKQILHSSSWFNDRLCQKRKRPVKWFILQDKSVHVFATMSLERHKRGIRLSICWWDKKR